VSFAGFGETVVLEGVDIGAGGVLPLDSLVLGVLSMQDWYDVREEEYATWHDPGWRD
jgi:hypothetical protein